MFVIVGLGNPGQKYQNNRHNVGFMMIDYLAAQVKNEKFKKKKMLQVTCYMLNDLILAKPQTFMNRSGLSVKQLIKNFKLKIKNLIVVHDDLDIPLGKFKIQKGVGPPLHNGIESIEQHLKTKDFWRVRIGVNARTKENWIDGETFVLNDFFPEEKNILMKEVFPEIFSRLRSSLLTAIPT